MHRLHICVLQGMREILRTNETSRGLHVQIKLQAHVRASLRGGILKKGAKRDPEDRETAELVNAL